MGRPKGNEKLWRGRPCNTQCSHENQKVKNGWFQKDEQGDISGDLAAALGIHRFSGISGRYEDRTILSNSILGETSWRTLHIEDLSSVISRLHFSVSGPWWNQATDWAAAYDWTQVLDWAGLQNKFTPALQFARAGMYLSDYAELGDTNACFPARSLDEFGDGAVLLSEADPTTGEHILSEHLSRVEFTEINERFEHGTQLGSMWVSGNTSQVSIETWQLEHGTVYTSASTPNPPAWAIPITTLSHYNGVYNNRHDFAGHLFGDGAGHLLGVSSAEIVPSLREHTRELAYDDSFELSRSRLSEFTPLINEQAISRGHTTSAEQTETQSAQWQAAAQTWDSADWSTDGWFEVEATAVDTWANTYSWRQFPQLEQVLGFSRTMLTLSESGHLSDSEGLLGDTHATLGFFEDKRVERSHQTTSTAHSPSGFWYHLRERFATLAYDDSFELSRTRLDEFIPLVNEQAITREHGSAATWLTEQFNSWNDTSPSWAAASDWQASGWFDAANEPTWFEAYAWQVFPQLEHVLSFHQSHQYLSDTTDGLSETDAVLGFEFSQRFERDHFAQATENRQSIAERQHVRTYYPATVALYVEPTWADGGWAGPGATDWHESTDDWQAGSWASADWLDSSTITWANQFMWGRIARWQIASLVVESVHETHA